VARRHADRRREEILHAAAAVVAHLDRAVSGSGTPAARLRAVLRLYAPAGTAPGWTMDIDAWAEALRSPESGTRPSGSTRGGGRPSKP
jgi:hypothetical protein